MLARLQQALTLGALVLAAAWAGWMLRAGHPGWAVAGVALVLLGHAAVLALEFALLWAVHDDSDPTPRATIAQLLRAWAGEAAAAPRVFCWRQPFFSRRWPDQLPESGAGAGGGRDGPRGVLLVHGFVCNRGIWNPWLRRLTAQGVPFVALNLEPTFGSIDTMAARVEDAVQRLTRCTGRAPIVVAHSMGGLVVRRWWAGAALNRVARLITIATPHRGTWLARFGHTANAREMRQRSPWLALLQDAERARAPESIGDRVTCFYGNCDNIVFPPAHATLPGADNRHLPGVAHVHMAERREPWDELQRALRSA